LDVGDQGIDELGVNEQSGAPGGQLDRSAQLVVAHWPHEDVIGAEQPRERRVGGAAAVEVGPDHGHDDTSGVALVPCAREDVDERMAFVVVATRGERLLERVDDEQPVLAREKLGLCVVQRAQGMLAGAEEDLRPRVAARQDPGGQRRHQPRPHER